MRDLEIGRRVAVPDGMTYPLVWVLWGKGMGRSTSTHVGTVSMGQRWQVRVNVRGWYIAVVVRRKEAR